VGSGTDPEGPKAVVDQNFTLHLYTNMNLSSINKALSISSVMSSSTRRHLQFSAVGAFTTRTDLLYHAAGTDFPEKPPFP